MCWSTKVAVSLECVKIEEKLLWRAYRTHQRSFEWYHHRPRTASSYLRLGVATPTQNFRLQPPPKTSVTIISGTGKPTNFKFGRNIPRVHLNKILLKILERRERWRIQGLVKLRTSNFVCTFIRSIGTNVL